MRPWPKSLLWRTVVTVAAVLVLSQGVLLGLSSYRQGQAVRDSRANQAAERIAAVVRALDAARPAERPLVLRRLSGPGFRGVVTPAALLTAETEDRRFLPVRELLVDVLGPPNRLGMVVRFARRVPWQTGGEDPETLHHAMMDRMGMMGPGAAMDGTHHLHAQRLARAWGRGPKLLAAVPLADGGWLNAAVPLEVEAPFWSVPNLQPFFLFGLLFAGLAVAVAWRALAPLARFAEAADRLGRDVNAPPLPETGPAEVRTAAEAFNAMQTRIRGFVHDRTQMLAAISHDLRTPITRLRLRAELIDDAEQRAKVLADLEEMERMIAATLAFARDEAADEAPRTFDLASLLQALCDDAADLGRPVSYAGPEKMPFTARPLALKRVFANLTDNALSHGGVARVTLDAGAEGVRVTVDDDGPGLDAAELDAVFKPFYRADKSRSKETGGAGLGLAVVRAIVRAHGGEVHLENRPEGGLRAVVALGAG